MALLTLIGAGPGDPELITLKGYRRLQQADVILYDALVNEELLVYAPQALKVFVGKRKGKCSFHQDEINELILHFANKGLEVIRLKGGDPFVFGRGFEEVLYAAEQGIKAEVIPGISSSISVPALQNIPVTSRGYTESFWVLTGTTKNHQLSEDVFAAAKTNATAVILMGFTKLSQICDAYLKEGKGEVPVAIIQEGSTDNERIVMADVNTIVQKAEEEGLKPPALIVIGEVVALKDKVRGLLEKAEEYNQVVVA